MALPKILVRLVTDIVQVKIIGNKISYLIWSTCSAKCIYHPFCLQTDCNLKYVQCTVSYRFIINIITWLHLTGVNTFFTISFTKFCSYIFFFQLSNELDTLDEKLRVTENLLEQKVPTLYTLLHLYNDSPFWVDRILIFVVWLLCTTESWNQETCQWEERGVGSTICGWSGS